MINTTSISRQRDKIQLEEVITCPECIKNLECITSITNSIYYYCSFCNHNKEIVFKNVELDNILKDIQSKLLSMVNTDKNINVLIDKGVDKIALYINNTYVSSRELSFEFTKEDMKQLNYTVLDLVEDIFGEGKVRAYVEYKIKLSK